MSFTGFDIKIPVPLLATKRRRYCSVKEGYLILLPDFVKYKMFATYQALNEDTEVWEDRLSNWRYTRKRSNISSVELGFDNDEYFYFVAIEFDGVAESTAWNFQNHKEALNLFTTLEDYFTSTNK